MKQFVHFSTKGLVLIFSAVAIVFSAVNLLRPFTRNDQVYVASTLEKERRADTLTGPRAFLVGGSNVALGVNSQKLSKAIKLKVVNMGVHAGLGLPFMLNETLGKLKKNDVAILSIEYFISKGDKKLQSQLVDINPSTMVYFEYSLSDKFQVVIQQLQRCLSEGFYKILHTNRLDPIYRRNSFNAEGDLVAHYGKSRAFSLGDNGLFTDTNFVEGFKSINTFIVSARQKGASTYFVFPAYAQSAYILNHVALDMYSEQCKHVLKCTVLGSVKESTLPDEYFFDTVYHLDSIGIEKRTSFIIEKLEQYTRFNAP